MTTIPLAQQLFEEVQEQKMHEAMNVFSHLAAPCIEQMKTHGLVVEDTDAEGRTIIRGTSKLATEMSIMSSCEDTGIEYEPTWADNA